MHSFGARRPGEFEGNSPQCIKKRVPGRIIPARDSRRTAATYSPNWWVSTIGADELNDSVRNGKRWILIALTTAIFYLRDYILSPFDSLLVKRYSGY